MLMRKGEPPPSIVALHDDRGDDRVNDHDDNIMITELSQMVMVVLFSKITSRNFYFASIGEQGCISCGTCSYLELTEDDVLTSAYVKIFRIVTRNAVNKSF